MPHEETRKIIKIGKTSFAVILPISWLRYYKLDATSHVKVISNDIVKIEPLKEDSGQ